MRFVTLTISSLLLVTSTSFGHDHKQMTQKEYVDLWSNVAVEQMTLHRIPASITLAQGLLESGNGNSPLAVEGNNHFGIKCSNWTGETIHVDDDIKNECFRKYPSATDSYVDHSIFLKKARYSKLFTLKIDDYKGWAEGLKAAGYATHPQYASKLIDLIERLKLNEYDEKTSISNGGQEQLAQVIKEEKASQAEKPASAATNTASTSTSSSVASSKTTPKETAATTAVAKPKEIQLDESALVYKSHQVLEHKNQVSYIVVQRGDTYYKIAQEFDLAIWQLYCYNDFESKKDILSPGDIVYIQPKRFHSKDKTNDSFIATEDMKLCEISQKEAIKMNALMKMNGFESEETIVKKGQKVLLR